MFLPFWEQTPDRFWITLVIKVTNCSFIILLFPSLLLGFCGVISRFHILPFLRTKVMYLRMVFNKIVYKTDPWVPEVSLRSSDDSLYPNVVHAKPQSVTLHLPTFQVYLISSAGVFCQSLTFTRVFAISSQNSHAIFTIVRNLALSANFVCNYCLGFHSLFVQLNSPEIEAQSL